MVEPDDEPEVAVKETSLGCGRLATFAALALAMVLVGIFAIFAALDLMSWQAVGIVAAVLIAAALILPTMLGRLLGAAAAKAFEAPFRMKAKALEGALAEVHAVTPTDPPAPAPVVDEDDDEDEDETKTKMKTKTRRTRTKTSAPGTGTGST